jgi:hypothetical protein
MSLAVAVPAASAAGTPSLQAVATRPLAVHGVRFRPSERVTVTVAAAGGVRAHVVRATRSGAFTTRFTAVWLDRCARWTVTARGAAGSVAVLRPRRFVDCSPQ